MRRAVVPTCLVMMLSCAPTRIPPTLRGYDILVESRDEQGTELARAMRESGFQVRRKVRGGGRPTAALIYFTFSTAPGEPVWLHLRLADTRSGVIVGAGTVQLDSTLSTLRARAAAAVHALLAP